MQITRFGVGIAIEGFHHLKIVNWVVIPMGWECSANDQRALTSSDWFDYGMQNEILKQSSIQEPRQRFIPGIGHKIQTQ